MSLQARDDARARLRPFGIIFEKSLHDLIRGIRSAKDPSAREAYLRDALADCREEVRSPDMDTKTMAILKLTYLEMYGYDMSWASFHVLEVMSSSKFQQKRVGYLAAIQSFRSDTDVLMLTTNLLKKDLGSAHSLEVSVALSGVATIVTPSLAQDISDDIVKMLNHSKPYIRKKAVLAMYRVFLQFPESFKTSFPRLRDKLEDVDPSVVSATVNVVCELAKQTIGMSSSKTFLALAPQLYELLTTSSNNWMLIKILKLFSSLAPTEPRLKTKLLPPILQLMESTTAMSLLYECINCIVSGGMLDESDYELAGLLVGKLRTFLEHNDQNLKYVGLLALSKIVNIHPQFVSNHQDIILECVDDEDLTIRERVLELISGVVDEDNIYSMVNRLLKQLKGTSATDDEEEDTNGSTAVDHALPKSYRIQVINKVISLCSKNMYALLPDFEWYTGVLLDLVDLADGADDVGREIGNQLRNIAVRVRSVRDTAVENAARIISKQNYRMPSVIPGAVWVVGEYAKFLRDPAETIDTIMQMSTHWKDEQDEVIKSCHGTSIQAIIKIYASWAGNDTINWTAARKTQVKGLTDKITKYLEQFITAKDFEIQERAVEFFELIKVVAQGIEEHELGKAGERSVPPLLLSLAVPSLFNTYELNPVAPNSQSRVPLPDDLDLDTPIYSDKHWIEDSIVLSNVDDSDREDDEVPSQSMGEEWSPQVEMTEEEIETRRLKRLQKQREDPFYIGNNNSQGSSRAMSPDTRSPLLSEVPSTASVTIKSKKKPRKVKVEIMQDEMIPGDDNQLPEQIVPKNKGKKSLLKLNSRLAELDLESDENEIAEASRLRMELLEKNVDTTVSNVSETVEVIHKKIKKKKKKVDEEDTVEGIIEKSKKKKPSEKSGKKKTKKTSTAVRE